MIPGMLISKADLLIKSEEFKVQDPVEYNRLLDGADDYNSQVYHLIIILWKFHV